MDGEPQHTRTPEEIAEINAARLARAAEDEARLSAAQGKRLRVNLDEAIREANAVEPLEFELLGGKYLVPRRAPADFAFVYLDRWSHQGPDHKPGAILPEVPAEDTRDLMRLVLGDEFAKAVESSRIQVADIFPLIVQPVLDAWGWSAGDPIDAGPGKNGSTPGQSPGPGGN